MIPLVLPKMLIAQCMNRPMLFQRLLSHELMRVCHAGIGLQKQLLHAEQYEILIKESHSNHKRSIKVVKHFDLCELRIIL
jgi:hypothetical protein